MKKILQITGIMVLLTSCGMFETKDRAPAPEPTIVQRLEDCVKKRINEGVKPLDALKICDQIYRGRFEE